MDHILQLPVHVQVALAGGYMGYTTAYSGIKSRHSARDALLLTLVFGLFSSIPYLAIMSLPQVSSDGVVTPLSVLAAVSVVICPVMAGVLWRRLFRTWWYKCLHTMGVHKDDGLATGWEALSQDPTIQVTQIMVRTSGGTELFCEKAMDYAKSSSNGRSRLGDFSPMLGTDGSVIMLVDTEETSSEGETRRSSQIEDEAGWGCRLTYIPANQIDYVELRVRDANQK